MFPGGINSPYLVKECSWGGVSGISDVLELNRRCFSCCNLVLQLHAGVYGKERKMVSTTCRGSYIELPYKHATRDKLSIESA